jgi:ribose 5-phosphate isomerase B
MIAIASDHAGFEYKEQIKKLLDGRQLAYRDFGTNSKDSTDYPDFALAVANAVSKGDCEQGILICGTGIGMSIVANKRSGIRAAACESATAARLAREHNDANILTLGERLTGWEVAADIVTTFITTKYSGGERHNRRVNKIHSLTNL